MNAKREQGVKKHSERVETLVDVSAAPELRGAVTGTFVGVTPHGIPLIDVSGARRLARSCVPLHTCDLGRDVVVAFDATHPDSPIVLGVIQPAATETVDITVDGKNVAVSAHESITLRCGNASITLNSDGKIVIRGAHVVTHASGVNRIRGGSVELN